MEQGQRGARDTTERREHVFGLESTHLNPWDAACKQEAGQPARLGAGQEAQVPGSSCVPTAPEGPASK